MDEELDELARTDDGSKGAVVGMDKLLLDMFHNCKPAVDHENGESDNVQVDFKNGLQNGADAVLENLAACGFQFGMKSAAGKRFAIWLKNHEDEWNKYSCGDASVKMAMRKQWASDKYDDYQKWRSKVTEVSKKSRARGTMVNLDQLIKRQGGRHSQSAVRGAIRIAKWCLAKGPPYVEVSERSGRLLFEDEERSRTTTEGDTWLSHEEERHPAAKRQK
eukprot:1412242-Pyramimonas_sp.AAC.1